MTLAALLRRFAAAYLVLLFVGVLHALAIWFYVGFTGKQYAVAEARRNKNNG